MPSQINVVSFVLRFVQETADIATASTPGAWYGLIRHVQTDHETRFNRLVDLVAFIARYVDLASLEMMSNAAGGGAAEMTETLTLM